MPFYRFLNNRQALNLEDSDEFSVEAESFYGFTKYVDKFNIFPDLIHNRLE